MNITSIISIVTIIVVATIIASICVVTTLESMRVHHAKEQETSSNDVIGGNEKGSGTENGKVEAPKAAAAGKDATPNKGIPDIMNGGQSAAMMLNPFSMMKMMAPPIQPPQVLPFQQFPPQGPTSQVPLTHPHLGPHFTGQMMPAMNPLASSNPVQSTPNPANIIRAHNSRNYLLNPMPDLRGLRPHLNHFSAEKSVSLTVHNPTATDTASMPLTQGIFGDRRAMILQTKMGPVVVGMAAGDYPQGGWEMGQAGAWKNPLMSKTVDRTMKQKMSKRPKHKKQKRYEGKAPFDLKEKLQDPVKKPVVEAEIKKPTETEKQPIIKEEPATPVTIESSKQPIEPSKCLETPELPKLKKKQKKQVKRGKFSVVAKEKTPPFLYYDRLGEPRQRVMMSADPMMMMTPSAMSSPYGMMGMAPSQYTPGPYSAQRSSFIPSEPMFPSAPRSSFDIPASQGSYTLGFVPERSLGYLGTEYDERGHLYRCHRMTMKDALGSTVAPPHKHLRITKESRTSKLARVCIED